MSGLIELKEVVYDVRAKDGTFCKLPYPRHPHGCPNFPTCILKHQDILKFQGLKWFAVIEPFDRKAHAEKMKLKHPDWSIDQCRCVLYWQKGVVSRLTDKAVHYRDIGDILLTVPEASGVHVFDTMAKVGVTLEREANFVQKVMFVGKHSDYPTPILVRNKVSKNG